MFQSDAGAGLLAAGAAGHEPVRVRERAGAGRRGARAQGRAAAPRAAALAALLLPQEGRRAGAHPDALQALQVTISSESFN